MNRSYLYTETAYHHEGDMNYLKELIDASAAAGAKGIKFQVLTNTADFVSTKHKAFEQLDKYCFTADQWREVFGYAGSLGLDIIMMPLNTGALELAKEFSIKYLDIHSVSFYDSNLLNKVKESGLEIILGVGGRTIEEIRDKKLFFGEKLRVLMVGFQAFPSKIEEVKIGKITYLKEMFPGVLIGYADHSSFDNEFAVKSNEYARLLGADIFEKHITVTEGVERVDYSAASSADKIKVIIDRLDFIDQFILTDKEHSFSFEISETTYRERQLRCVCNSDIKKGSVLTRDMISLKLVDDQDNTFSNPEDLIGKKAVTDLGFDMAVKIKDIV